MHADALHTHNPLFAPFTIDNGDATEGYLVIAEEIASVGFAITCKSELSDTVRAYVEAGIAPATRRAYKADLEHFRAWGGGRPKRGKPSACGGRHAARPRSTSSTGEICFPAISFRRDVALI